MLAPTYFALLYSRNPYILRRPQFWAEEGHVFYQQAHALGFVHTVLLQFGGYLHVLPRIVAGISLLVPLAKAPLVFAIAALLVQCAPAIYLSSSRMRNVGPLWMRILLSFLYLGVPAVGEVHGVLLHAQSHLSVLCLLILLAAPTASVAVNLFEYAVLFIGAFTGPFSIFLTPVALLVFWTRRERRSLWQTGMLAVGAFVQGFLVLRFRPEGVGAHGASVSAFCRILAFQVIVPVFRGINPSGFYAGHPGLLNAMSYAITFGGLAALAYIFLRGSLEVRCAALFGAEAFAAALLSSTGTFGHAWDLFQQPLIGQRYWYIPELAVIAATMWLVTRPRNALLRVAGGAVLLLLLSVEIHYWAVFRLPYAHWDKYAAEFRGLPVGASMKIPINPIPPPGQRGMDWSVELTKTPRDR